MKKTKKRALLVIAVVLVLALLLTPIPLGLKDGGSVRFKALVYEVTKFISFPRRSMLTTSILRALRSKSSA